MLKFMYSVSKSVNQLHFLSVPLSTPTLLLPTIEENTSTSIQCVIDSVKPGLGSVLFTVTVGSDIIVESVDSKISEESSEPGTVSVTYSDTLSLQRKHNRQQAVCTVVWRDGEETVTSESVTVDVLCKYSNLYISMYDRNTSRIKHTNNVCLFFTYDYGNIRCRQKELAQNE